MKIYNNFNDYQKVANAIVTIGTFDGVHLGHQTILKDMVRVAKEIKGESVVVTFYPHPRQVLRIDDGNLRFITTQEEKIRLLENIGIDNLIIVNFTEEFSRLSSESFITDYVIKNISPVKIVVGYDHHFGNNRKGDFNLLNDLGERYDIEVQRIPAKDVENIAVSSTKIRHSLQRGDVCYANRLLGYQYAYFGKVVDGAKIGRELGYPTANVNVDREYRLIESPGVYATYIEIDKIIYKSMTYIGNKPTLDKDEKESVEVHIFDFNDDIYGKYVKIRFVKKIREEQKFKDLETLKHQIQIDEKEIREILLTF